MGQWYGKHVLIHRTYLELPSDGMSVWVNVMETGISLLKVLVLPLLVGCVARVGLQLNCGYYCVEI